MENPKIFELDCSCHCSKLAVSYWDDKDDETIILSHFSSSWNSHSRQIRTALSEMFGLIWCALRGKQYLFFEMVIPKDRIQEFKKWVAEL
jgi:hypothetical protein